MVFPADPAAKVAPLLLAALLVARLSQLMVATAAVADARLSAAPISV